MQCNINQLFFANRSSKGSYSNFATAKIIVHFSDSIGGGGVTFLTREKKVKPAIEEAEVFHYVFSVVAVEKQTRRSKMHGYFLRYFA